MSPTVTPRSFWQSRSRAVARRINFAAWFGLAAPAGFFILTAFAAILYALRRLDAPVGFGWFALVAALTAAATGCWWRARPRFYGPGDARVLLESRLRLDARLTAAELGLVPWPAAPAHIPAVLDWRLRTPLAWFAGGACMVALASLAPVPHETATARHSSRPPALEQTDAMLSAIKELQVADPDSIAQLESRARELARRPADEQYSHSALEAADALRDQTAAAAAGLARNLEATANAMRDGDAGGNNTAGSRLAAALSGLRDGTLPASVDLLAGLPGTELDLKNLTAAQRSALAERLGTCAGELSGIAGACAAAAVAQPNPDALCQGSGGPGGGGESAPLALSPQASDVGPGRNEALEGEAMQRFALGDKLRTASAAHHVDPAKTQAPMSAGAVAGTASGGEAVWVNRLTPSERAVLKDFFK